MISASSICFFWILSSPTCFSCFQFSEYHPEPFLTAYSLLFTYFIIKSHLQVFVIFKLLNIIQNLFQSHIHVCHTFYQLLLVNSAKMPKMLLLPVRTCNACILNRIPAMDHHVISYINSNMARSRRIISFLEKDQISRLCIRWRYIGTIRPKSICCCSSRSIHFRNY